MYTKYHTKEEFEKEENLAIVCAMALTNWGHTHMGITPPPDFGEAMVVAGNKLGIVPMPDNFRKYAEEVLKV